MEIYNWVFVPEFQIDNFSKSKLNTMLYGKNIKSKSKYVNLDNNRMHCPIIFISENPLTGNKKISIKLCVICCN